MAGVPVKVAAKIASGLKRFQPILESAKSRDVNESDTVIIVTDVLNDVFGYDKFTELTSEHSIKSTFCDLAILLDGELTLLVEVKAIGSDLKSAYIKQAVDYAANKGVEWVVLTNGILWNIYRVTFTKPIDAEMVAQLCLSEMNPKDDEDIERLWMLSKDGWQRSALVDHHERQKAFNRFTLGALLLSEPLLTTLRREIKKAKPGLKVECAEIETMLSQEVIKRDVLEGDKADAARKAIAKAFGKAMKAKSAAVSSPSVVVESSASDACNTADEDQSIAQAP